MLRKSLLLLSIVLVGGSLATTTGYGLRLRSASYRRQVSEDLSRFFEMPCEVGRISGRTFSSRAFDDVNIWLPDRRDRVFFCSRAIWDEHEVDDREHNSLALRDGLLVLGTDRWVRSDYKQILQSGLGHDFEDLHLDHVQLDGFEISFDRGELSIRCRETSGSIDFSELGTGIARLHAYELNGYRISQGAQIHASFQPRQGVRVSELILTLPEVPLASIGLGRALGGEIHSGHFAGSVQYVNTGPKPEVWVRGDLRDADLAEMTRTVPFGPLEGRVSVRVDGARIADSLITHIRGQGHISDFDLSPFATILGRKDLSGKATLDLDDVDIALGKLNRLRLSADIRGLSLTQWLEAWGKGKATGIMSIRINNLDIVNNGIKSADVEISVKPPPGKTGTIDREMLLSLAGKAFDITWPSSIPQSILPDSIAYTRCGLRLLVQDNEMRILGTHGEDGDTILTISIAGAEFGVIKSPSHTYDLAPHIDNIIEQLRTYDTQHVKDWWRQRHKPEPGN
jgi:hypothetical protein